MELHESTFIGFYLGILIGMSIAVFSLQFGYRLLFFIFLVISSPILVTIFIQLLFIYKKYFPNGKDVDYRQSSEEN